jgi:hypothetical protein
LPVGTSRSTELRADEFAVAMALHAAPDHPPVKYAERGEQGCRAAALVVVRHGLVATRF